MWVSDNQLRGVSCPLLTSTDNCTHTHMHTCMQLKIKTKPLKRHRATYKHTAIATNKIKDFRLAAKGPPSSQLCLVLRYRIYGFHGRPLWLWNRYYPLDQISISSWETWHSLESFSCFEVSDSGTLTALQPVTEGTWCWHTETRSSE